MWYFCCLSRNKHEDFKNALLCLVDALMSVSTVSECTCNVSGHEGYACVSTNVKVQSCMCDVVNGDMLEMFSQYLIIARFFCCMHMCICMYVCICFQILYISSVQVVSIFCLLSVHSDAFKIFYMCVFQIFCLLVCLLDFKLWSWVRRWYIQRCWKW